MDAGHQKDGNVVWLNMSRAFAMAVHRPAIGNDHTSVFGTTALTRTASFPDHPTIAETGLPNYTSLGSFGLFAPAAPPPATVDRSVRTSVRSCERPTSRSDWPSRLPSQRRARPKRSPCK
ncbi:MAG: hypothetical protein GEU95_17325 [Rhizobiales bacterium]|nr:hypothetical protein [Hyphomicrobiales bacterium]